MINVLTPGAVDRVLEPRQFTTKKIENWNLLVIDAMIDKKNNVCNKIKKKYYHTGGGMVSVLSLSCRLWARALIESN
jgi:hypothetical protein